MAKRSETGTPSGRVSPQTFAKTPRPPDLVPSESTNMYVVGKIGELTTAVTFLTDSIREQGTRLASLQKKANWVEGGLVVATIFLTGIAGFVYWLLSAKWNEALELLKALEPILSK